MTEQKQTNEPLKSEQSNAGKKNRRLKQLALLVATLILGAIGLEVVYRIYTHAKFKRTAASFENELYEMTPGDALQYQLKRGAARTNRVPGNEDGEWSYAINADGFRTPLPGEKREGVRRILALGDSYTFGWALDESLETYPRALERILNEDAGTTNTEVINAGVPGYGSTQEARLLEILAEKYEPDFVILGYVPNDAEPQFTVPGSPEVLYRYTRIWLPERLKQAVNQMFEPEPPIFAVNKHWYKFNYLEGFEEASPKWKESREALASMAAICREKKIGFAVFLIPDFSKDFRRTYPYEKIHQAVSSWGNELDIEVIDLLPELSSEDSSQLRIPADLHPNEAGHELLAQIMARKLSGVLPEPRAE